RLSVEEEPAGLAHTAFRERRGRPSSDMRRHTSRTQGRLVRASSVAPSPTLLPRCPFRTPANPFNARFRASQRPTGERWSDPQQLVPCPCSCTGAASPNRVLNRCPLRWKSRPHAPPGELADGLEPHHPSALDQALRERSCHG